MNAEEAKRQMERILRLSGESARRRNRVIFFVILDSGLNAAFAARLCGSDGCADIDAVGSTIEAALDALETRVVDSLKEEVDRKRAALDAAAREREAKP